MWQSRVEIEHYSVAYFDRVTAFKACSAVVPLRMGLIRTAKLHQCLIRYVYGVAILFILNKVLQDNYTFKHYYSVQLTPPYYVTIVLLPQAIE